MDVVELACGAEGEGRNDDVSILVAKFGIGRERNLDLYDCGLVCKVHAYFV